jgi:hypothetical protein
LVSDIPAGDRKIAHLFLQCIIFTSKTVHAIHAMGRLSLRGFAKFGKGFSILIVAQLKEWANFCYLQLNFAIQDVSREKKKLGRNLVYTLLKGEKRRWLSFNRSNLSRMGEIQDFFQFAWKLADISYM